MRWSKRNFSIVPKKNYMLITPSYRNIIKTLVALITVLYTVKIFKLSPSQVNAPKYILLWTPLEWYPFNTWKMGAESFIKNRCRFTNCIISARDEMSVELSRFDAIAFNERHFSLKTNNDHGLLPTRYNHQKYIFFITESADRYPICDPIYDGFFNWTATYKLSSDIVYSYFVIKNSSGDVIGPKIDMNWPNNEETELGHLNKTKAVAWFVSRCGTRSKREIYAKKLKNALKKHNLELDVYGNCGELKCSRKRTNRCNEILSKYYFYLAFENSFAEDYVTEKLLRPIQNYNVPIVYGGANYSRFLPPGSYLNARSHSPGRLAAIIARVIGDPVEYKQFFKWSRYRYEAPANNICRLCEALNNEDLMKTSQVYNDLRRWWNPDYEKRCKNLHLFSSSRSTSGSPTQPYAGRMHTEFPFGMTS